MIRYRLSCVCGHEFEAWFASGRAYDDLAARSAVRCPACGGADVGKAIMAPSIAAGAAAPAVGKTAAPGMSVGSAHAELVALTRQLRQQVAERAEYVGSRFAVEARRIDAGEAPDRGIFGEATQSEAKALIDDGISILPLPRLPEESN
jgi:hypothetical protein